jgi:hypothetical protein
MEGSTVKVMIDSGASCIIMAERTFKQLKTTKQLQQTTKTIHAYGSATALPIKGVCHLQLSADTRVTSAPFYVMQGDGITIVGRKTAFELTLLQINKPGRQPQGETSAHTELTDNSSTDEIVKAHSHLFKGLGFVKGVEVKVQMREDAVPVCHPPSRVPIHLKDAVVKELQSLIKMGVIERVTGPSRWVSRMVTVPKASGDVRICQDLRDVNKFVVPEKQPIPTLEDVTEDMAGSKVFSELDVLKAFHQIPVHEDSREIFTFSTPLGLMRLKRLSMGFTNASEILQRVMTGILSGLPGVRWTHDDIIVYGKDQREHNQRLNTCLQRIGESGLTLNRDKCKFSTTNVDFLGMRLSINGIQPSEEKVIALRNFKAPTNVSETRSFLGLANYLSRFIPNFADITAPLRSLTKKCQSWEWTEQHEKAFKAIQTATCDNKILAFFDKKLPSKVLVNALHSQVER